MSQSHESGPPPSVAILQMLTGKWISQSITTAAQLNLADHLANGPKSCAELAELSRSNERALRGLLRALASVGIFSEDAGGRFENTATSEILRTKINGSMRAMALFFGEHPSWAAWGELLYTVRTGSSGFKRANGALPYEFFAKQGAEGAYFHEAFTGFSAQEMEAIHRAFDFSDIETLVDVGGGQGAMLCSSLRKNERQRGILFDQPEVVAGADSVIASFGVGDRCRVVGGDFFDKVPADADGYMLKHVLFNWKDEDAVKILRAVRRAMGPRARLFVVDPVIRPGNAQTFAKFLDLEMMVLYDGGCQRTEVEFRNLLREAGLEVTRIVDTDAPSSILEARPI